MKKRLLTLLLALLLIAGLIPVSMRTAFADVVTGQCGDSLDWSFDTDAGVLTITGSGAMYGYFEDPAPWYAYTPYIIRVDLPDGLTSIGSAATTITSASSVR